MTPLEKEKDFTQRALIIADILKEHERAVNLHPPFNSRHEGYAILLEELDELWDIIKINHAKKPECRDDMKKEAIQVAAMAIRFIEDCCGDLKESW
jgi:hypothetical protein